MNTFKTSSNNYISSDSQHRREKIILYSNPIGIISTLIFAVIYAFTDFRYLWPASLILLGFCVPYLLSHWLYRKKKVEIARHVLLLNITATISVFTIVVFGPKPGIHFFFIMIAMLPALMWSFQNKLIMAFYFLVNISLFFFVEFIIERESFWFIPPANILPLLRIISYLCSFSTIAIVLIVYQILSEENENNILKLNKVLNTQKQELKQANETKDRFISIIAHDLKNPMTAISGYSEMLLKKNDYITKEVKDQIISRIYTGVAYTNEFLDNLLSWSKLQDNKINTEIEVFDLKQLIEKCLLSVENSYTLKDINIIKSFSDDHIVSADIKMTNIIITNLLTNAIKYSFRGATIFIAMQNAGKKVQLNIKDTGIGISPEKIDEIFFKAYQTSTPGTENEKGTGLGLNLCKVFAEMNDGDIWVKSDIGEGSTFFLTLPKVQV